MASLSDLRLDVRSTFMVEPDGTEGELVYQELRYQNIADGKSYPSAEEALLDLDPAELEKTPEEDDPGKKK